MREAGYGSLPLPELINARDHGITPEYVRELGSAGYAKLPLDQLINVRDHGVTPDYVRDMQRLGLLTVARRTRAARAITASPLSTCATWPRLATAISRSTR